MLHDEYNMEFIASCFITPYMRTCRRIKNRIHSFYRLQIFRFKNQKSAYIYSYCEFFFYFILLRFTMGLCLRKRHKVCKKLGTDRSRE